MPKGKIEIPNAGRQNGYVIDEQGNRYEFRYLDSPALDINSLAVGTRVEFMIGKIGTKPMAIQIKVIGSAAPPADAPRATPDSTAPHSARQSPQPERTDARQSSRAPQQASKHSQSAYRFLNPYNFVRTLEPKSYHQDSGSFTKLFGKFAPPPHDRWLGLSGTIACSLTAVTPIFVSGSEGVTSDEQSPKHKKFSFYRVNGTKTIPGSSLRGSLRTIYEIITNSCLATLDGKRLSYRLDTKDARRLVPARIEKTESGGFVLQALSGSAVLDPNVPPKELYAGALRQYRAYKPTGRNPSANPPPPIGLQGLGHGDPCWAVLRKVDFPKSWRVEGVARSESEANTLSTEIKKVGRAESEYRVQQGWLCLTNQNADNKHSERFFFAQAIPTVIPLDKDIIGKYQDLIKDYQDRHARTVEQIKVAKQDPSKPFANDPKKPYKFEMGYSRFVLNPAERGVKGGELVYAMLKGRGKNLTVEFLAPVSVPRVAYENTIANLLYPELAHCGSRDNLCPACRVFGWVSDNKQKETGYASRLAFSDASLDENTAKPQSPMRLAILGSPKPTTTRFYLFGPDGLPSELPRNDFTSGYDGNEGKNRLRGRKIYRHHTPDPAFALTDLKSDQNRTIEDAEGAGATFNFEIRFENMAAEELGALLWTLNLGGKGYHRLGYGKPLGLGSAEIKIKEVQLLDVKARYTSLEESGYRQVENWGTLVDNFESVAAAHWGTPFGELAPVQDLFALVGRAEPKLRVHYPFAPDPANPTRPDPKTQGAFEWFVGNKRDKGPKVELDLAATDSGLPFIDRTGKVY